MSNRITIELCEEDRVRIDKLTAAMERLTEPTASEEPKKATKAPKEPTEEAKAPAPQVTPKEEPKQEETAEAEPTEAPETTEPEKAPEPTVTLQQIQQKVVQLAAGFNGTKKAKVRAIINEYGAKVSDLQELPDKWNEVWAKLTALEKEEA